MNFNPGWNVNTVCNKKIEKWEKIFSWRLTRRAPASVLELKLFHGYYTAPVTSGYRLRNRAYCMNNI